MTDWLCKRCGLTTSADHSQGDCIAASRKRIAKLEQENARLGATIVNGVGGGGAGNIRFYEITGGSRAGTITWTVNGGDGGSIGSTQGVS